MSKLRLSVCLLIVLLTGLARAQDTAWTAWLYQQAEGRMTQVEASGAALDEFTLPMPSGFDQYPRQVAVGQGGAPFAYVVFNGATFQGALVAARRDGLIGSFNLPLTFSDSLEFIADEAIFNEDNSALALGYSLDGGGWAIIVFDLNLGAVTQTLRHDAPLVAILGLPDSFGLTPVIRRFAGRNVTFTMVLSGTEGAAEYESYTWTLDSDNLAKTPVYPGLDSDTFHPTGEVVMSLPDERLPNESEAFIFYQANTLQVYDPALGARFPFYNAAEATLFTPNFIQNGEFILVDSTDSAGRYQWRVVGRDGRVAGTLPSAVTINDVAGVGDGFIYTTEGFSPGATTLVYVNSRDGLDAGVPIWTSAPNAAPVIAWAQEAVPSAQSVYAPWAKLADAVYEPGGAAQIAPAQGQPLLTPQGVSPSEITQATPAFGRFLSIGGLALVNTTDGDQLNVRSGPGRSFDVVTRLSDGERVTLVEGPRDEDGFIWWKVRTAAGLEGWVVESVDDGGTRLQTLLPG